ncbi:beta-glucosidase [Pantoea sp. Acro-805]|uniref:Beta-glucosidase n=1 Tax=Candidatus Pantoea formicae TaxID=2608355 RepID=A0ABX0QRG6_9GAMM|nr:beta-glucosidase [Pantoea formicae]MDF7649771.1 beta-glucosidase [Erwiniaceae bacterium L1_54_3]NIE99531.1 beta-glucosidase [Pantoea formicae]
MTQQSPHHHPHLFNSFFQGSFPCSTACRSGGRRIDMVISSGHDMLLEKDYAALAQEGLLTARDGARWHLIEATPNEYDWRSFLPMIHAAARHDMQIIWELAHFGYPDHLDIWRTSFIDHFERFARAMAQLMRDEGVQHPFFTPINQISFWSWAGADVSWLDPYASERGRELKRQLVRATLAAMHAIRDVYPDARFVLTDPLVQIAPDPDNPDSKPYADAQNQAQFEAWDWIAGRDAPELGGREDFLDILGLNYYPDNHWFLSGDTLSAQHAAYQPLHQLLLQCWQRYQRPLLLAETGAEGDARAPWLRHVTEEAILALAQGVALEGISLYPVVEYPAWADDRRSPGALFGLGDPNGNRTLHEALALELRSQQIKWRNQN